MFDPAAPIVVGANLPWITYGCDFGANAWRPAGGVATTGIPPSVRRALGDLRDRGGTLVRWFLFCDGRAGIRFDGDRPVGLDDFVTADLDAALDLLDATGLRVIFVLLDFHWCLRRRDINGVQLSGRQRVLTRADLRASLLENVDRSPLSSLRPTRHDRRVGHHQRTGMGDVRVRHA